ncbi:MAG TPA: zinc-dependent alcohol dehydrogenase family protein [Bacteroidales bacterium]|nr:zinc-dependent alcohol dehydrogenase family protein [Bacteroidales bacterium]HQG36752.1 zinc-dependent alcohol dehydrogenase family protein [Bacteroidales bacterium]HQG53238.1 zinc-dependent alcohol dehydrogenase family protein [Bacteroidales bacterium]HQJ21340.1 zinc-dependent alcohol dehydrogenase family protein [Bacteroidales bacterium]
MKAMILKSLTDISLNREPLVLSDMPEPEPSDNEVLIKVTACGVCHTELDEIEGRTPPPELPVIPGHQVIGRVVASGRKVNNRKPGDRVGVAWIFSSCGKCDYCLQGMENLCPEFRATGRDANGGYAEYMTVPADFTYIIPDNFTDVQAAPLLCAGAVGYRSVKLTALKNGQNIGLTGFGASGHIVLKIIKYKYPDTGIFVFARNESERSFALELGASWAGDTTEKAPELLDSIIDTTPVWKPVVEALKNLKPAGRLVINAIRKEEADKDYLLNIDYPACLWMEKEIKSVANVTRSDVEEFLQIASEIPVIPEVQEYRLEEANLALTELKERKIRGAKVLVI